MTRLNIRIEEVELMWKGEEKAVNLVFLEDGCDPDGRYGDLYYINSMGDRVFVKTFNRELAQAAVDAYYGKPNFFIVRSIRGAKQKGDTPSVRATEYRKNQNQQRQKAKILNS